MEWVRLKYPLSSKGENIGFAVCAVGSDVIEAAESIAFIAQIDGEAIDDFVAELDPEIDCFHLRESVIGGVVRPWTLSGFDQTGIKIHAGE